MTDGEMATINGEYKLDAVQFESEVGSWAYDNFPKATLLQPMAGIVEEVGEFEDVQGCDSQHDADALRDAIGDVMVFMAHYCAMSKTADLWAVVDDARHYAGRLQINVVSAMGRLAHGTLKVVQGIRGDQTECIHRALVEIVCWCMAQTKAINDVASRGTTMNKMSFDEVVIKTWQRVKNRNWQADPEKGGE